MATATVLSSIQEKYNDDVDDYGFIVFISNSPETKQGLFPPIMTLCDYNINSVGSNGIAATRLCHITELDLTGNLFSDWREVAVLLKKFQGLRFLNLSNNLLNEVYNLNAEEIGYISNLRKLVLNGNKIDWNSAERLTRSMPNLEELHLSKSSLRDPKSDENFSHGNVRLLYLSRNQISNFDELIRHLKLPELELLSLAECPIENIPSYAEESVAVLHDSIPKLRSLNLSSTEISSWKEIDNVRTFPNLSELRIKNCPFYKDCEISAHERRMFLIARLPNIRILNGGDVIPAGEREDAERAFIRFFNEDDLERRPPPPRWYELVEIHGRLDPLVNINLAPDTHAKIKIIHKDQVREEVINLYQTVQQFKSLIHQWFDVPTQNMKIYYVDQTYEVVLGPEEMKWPQKELYTYNVQNGDSFIVDLKVSTLGRLRTNSGRSLNSMSPKSSLSSSSSSGRSSGSSSGSSPTVSKYQNNSSQKVTNNHGSVSRNLFGRAGTTTTSGAKNINNHSTRGN